jgi:hypothetical protein
MFVRDRVLGCSRKAPPAPVLLLGERPQPAQRTVLRDPDRAG